MKVIGFGDNVVDRYINRNVYYPGGNALNFSVYAKMCGVDSAYLGVFADDRESQRIRFALREAGVECTHCKTEPGTTTERFDVVLQGSERIFVGDDERDTKPHPRILSARELAYLAEFDFIHSGCYAGTEDEIAKLYFDGSLVGFDFSEEPEYRTDTYLMKLCPHLDLALFSCAEDSKKEAQALQSRAISMGAKYVLATRGLDGQDFFDGRHHYRGKAKLCESVDTMGAGDSFYAAFVTTLLKDGWRKGTELSADMIIKALENAARFSAEICGINGSFGYGEAIG